MVAQDLRKMGYTVVNPAEFSPSKENPSWRDFLDDDIKAMRATRVNLILFLDDQVTWPRFKESRGTQVEKTWGRKNKVRRIKLSAFIKKMEEDNE